MQKKWMLRILVPVFMVFVVVGMWAVQNQAEEPAAEDADPLTLDAQSIDLPALKEYNLPIIIDFGADSCEPCKAMAPVLSTLNAEMQEKAIIKFVDVWKNPKGATGYPVQVIPTQVFIGADGLPYIPSEAVANEIPFTIYTDDETQEPLFTVHQGGLSEEQMRLILQDMGVE